MFGGGRLLGLNFKEGLVRGGKERKGGGEGRLHTTYDIDVDHSHSEIIGSKFSIDASGDDFVVDDV